MTPECGDNLQHDLANLLADSTYHDIHITCADGVKLTACRAILAARSLVFKAMLYGSMREGTDDHVSLGDIGSSALHVVLHFLHTGDIVDGAFEPAVALEAYRAAGFFLLPRLMRMVLERTQEIDDIAIAADLLNEAVEAVPPGDANAELYDVLLRPFCVRALQVGDLNGLSEEALDFLLTKTHDRKFNTPEHTLLLCVVDWAWARSGALAPSTAHRHALLSLLEAPPSTSTTPPPPAAQIRMPDDASRDSLISMLSHLNLVLVCPHRLRALTASIDALASPTPQHIAFCHYACANTKCAPGHPSGLRGKAHGEWDPSHLGDGLSVSAGGAVIELPADAVASPTAMRTVRLAAPLTQTSAGGLAEWDMVIEATGTRKGKPAAEVGLVGERFDRWDDNMMTGSGAEAWAFQSYSTCTFLKRDKINASYGAVLKAGDVVTFRLDMNERTCSLAINGKDYGLAWRDLPDRVYPAVSLFPGSRYRFGTDS